MGKKYPGAFHLFIIVCNSIDKAYVYIYSKVAFCISIILLMLLFEIADR